MAYTDYSLKEAKPVGDLSDMILIVRCMHYPSWWRRLFFGAQEQEWDSYFRGSAGSYRTWPECKSVTTRWEIRLADFWHQARWDLEHKEGA